MILFYNNFTYKFKNFINKRYFFSLTKGKSFLLRVGPHNKDFISFLLGSILGDTHLEKRKNSIGVRIIFEQCQRNVEYLIWFQKFLIIRGYCPDKKPMLRKKINKNNKIFFYYRINSYTFSSLIWFYELFYDNNIKIIPENHIIWENFTEFSLAIWYMNDGSKTKSGFRLVTNSFTLENIRFLCLFLKKKFNLDTNIHSSGKNKGFIIYIKATSKDKFILLVEPYMLNSMKYKLYKN